MFSAVQQNDHEVLHTLLQYKAYPNAAVEQGITPLILAALNNNTEATKSLLAAGADTELANDHGATATFVAAQQNSCNALEVGWPFIAVKCMLNKCVMVVDCGVSRSQSATRLTVATVDVFLHLFFFADTACPPSQPQQVAHGWCFCDTYRVQE